MAKASLPYSAWMRRISATTRSRACVPGDRPEPARRRRVALERVQQPVGMAALQVALHALGAELALVERELVPGLEPDDLVVLHLQLDAALLAAEAAVGLDHPVDLEPASQPPGGASLRCGPYGRSAPLR